MPRWASRTFSIAAASTSRTPTRPRTASAAATPAASPISISVGSVRIDAQATWLAEIVTLTRRLSTEPVGDTIAAYGISYGLVGADS